QPGEKVHSLQDFISRAGLSDEVASRYTQITKRM
ncbi:hypothetical protein OMW_01939, partial [Enterococcus columbae DSM 7374 = ATCC 51263]